MNGDDRIYFRINGSVPTSVDAGALEQFLHSIKSIAKEIFAPLPEASCRAAASYKDEDGDEVDITIWEKRPKV